MNFLLLLAPLRWASVRVVVPVPATARPAAAVKGQKARSGGKVRVGFEGGQMPLARRIPKRGFHNVHAKPLTAVNVAALNCFEDGAVVDAAALIEAGVISACPYGLKVLSNGTLTKKVTVKAAAFSESAKEKIEQAGGKAEVV